MKLLRKVIFWLHLVAGVAAGLVILLMAATGIAMSFERQIMELAQRVSYPVEPPSPEARRMDLNELVEKARLSVPEPAPTALALRSDGNRPVNISFGREKVLWLNPYTGAVFEDHTSALGGFFQFAEDLHRWLALEGDFRDSGKAVTGAACMVFAFLLCTGIYLWWPHHLSRNAWRGALVPRWELKGKARDWNWHTTFGFWMALPLLIVILTGLIMAYPWANNLIFILSGEEPPPARQEGGAQKAAPPVFVPANLDLLVGAVDKQVPAWVSLQIRFPGKKGGPVAVAIEEPHPPHPFARSTVTLDAASGTIVKWEPFSGQNTAKKIRSFIRPVHTGEAGGILGQALAALAAATAAVLVWTGLALSLRRFLAWRKR